MSGDRPSPRQRVAAAALRAAAAALRWLPARVAYALADAASLPLALWALAHERRVRALGRGFARNQRVVFREALTPARARALFRGWVRHLAYLAVDFARMPLLGAANVERCVDTAEMWTLRSLLDEGRGLLCVSGHLGVWELLGHVPSVLGIPVTVVVRPRASAPVEAAFNEIRRAGGQIVLEKSRALWPLKKALDAGRVVGFLADEDAPQRPVFAPFLGTLAATSPAAAFLQRATGAPIAVVSCHRCGRGRYRYHVWAVIRHDPHADPEAAARNVTRAINDALSRALLAYPEQWLWGARRFSTRPPGERPGCDGLPPRAQPELRREAG